MKTKSKITSAEFLFAMTELWKKQDARKAADGQLRASIADCIRHKQEKKAARP